MKKRERESGEKIELTTMSTRPNMGVRGSEKEGRGRVGKDRADNNVN